MSNGSPARTSPPRSASTSNVTANRYLRPDRSPTPHRATPAPAAGCGHPARSRAGRPGCWSRSFRRPVRGRRASGSSQVMVSRSSSLRRTVPGSTPSLDRRRHHVLAETRDQVGGGEADDVSPAVQKDRVVGAPLVRFPKRYDVVQIAQRLDAREGRELVPPRPCGDDGGEAVRSRRQPRRRDADRRHRIGGRRQSPHA